jgi:hypothetical protein
MLLISVGANASKYQSQRLSTEAEANIKIAFSGSFLVLISLTSPVLSSVASPVGYSNVSHPIQCRNGNGIHSTNRVKTPIRLPKVLAKIVPRP